MTTTDPDMITLSPTVFGIITAGFAETSTMATNLVDSLMAQLATANATLDAIREGVTELFEGPYMPTPAAVGRALYPYPSVVDSYREGAR